MVKEIKPTTQNRIFDFGFSMKVTTTKNATGDWHAVIEAVGNRPRFEGSGKTKGTAMYNLHREFKQWLKDFISNAESGEAK